ncbi:MAG TPA: DUF5606 domain-containing protein [Mariniphaga sp.]|nr:DUF5606 domain-containing protein [Mariniphaga sp.]
MLKGILAVSGHQGLFKHVADSKNSIIVESLDTGKRMPVYASSKISALEDIAIYTESADVPLKDVFKAIYEKENGSEALSHKSTTPELKKYFGEVLPEYDKDRVYMSDIKKVLLWYNLLQEKSMLDFTEEEESDSQEESKEDEASE